MDSLILVTSVLQGFVFIIVPFSIYMIFTCLCGSLDKKKFLRKWVHIEKLSRETHTGPLALIYACNLLDDALKKRGYNGTTLLDRLEISRSFFGSVKRAREAVKLRHHFAHCADFEQDTNSEEIVEALAAIRSELVRLGALD